MVQFEEASSIGRVELMFQGGFGAKRCTLGFVDQASGRAIQTTFYPQDSNALQRQVPVGQRAHLNAFE